MSIQNNLLASIFIGKEKGSVVSTAEYKKLKIWRRELNPMLKRLEELHYIKIRYTKKNIQYIIRKPITQMVVNKVCS